MTNAPRIHGPLMILVAASTCVRAGELHVPADYASIQAAIDASTAGDQVVVAPGTYRERLDLRGKEIIVRASGGADVTTLDGDGLAAPIILARSGETLATTVEGFTLANGEGGLLPNCSNKPTGGAAYISSGSGLTFRGCTFYRNGYNLDLTLGGAIMVFHSGALHADECTFEQNGGTLAESELRCAYGGAIATCGGSGAISVQITGCVFVDNQAAFGGAVFLDDAADARVADSVFTANKASHGGGLNLAAVSGATVTGCYFDANEAAHGGGITTGDVNDLLVEDCDFIGNVASHGGGMSGQTHGSLEVAACRFTGNQAAFGGGLTLAAHADRFVGGTMVVAGCDFVDNHAGFGGGLFAQALASGTSDPPPSLTLTDSRFIDNSAMECCDTGVYRSPCWRDGRDRGTYYGGGADLREQTGGLIRVGNCLFTGNAGTSAGGLHVATCGEPDFDLRGGVIDVANSTFVGNDGIGILARIGRSGTITVQNSISLGHPTDQNVVVSLSEPVDGEAIADVRYSNIGGGYGGEGNIDAAPIFENEGDFRLAAGSPGIDAADNGAIADWLSLDLAGGARFVDDPATEDTGLGDAPIVDMGAYEFQGSGCAADLNDDGHLNLFDFLAFQSAFGNEDPGADLAPPFGVFNLFDFLAFQTAFGNGC